MSKKLSVRYGSMNTAKSLQLLAVAHNYSESNQKVHILTSTHDDRTGRGLVATRLGVSREAEVFDSNTDFFALIGNLRGVACVLIDEAQFVTPKGAQQIHQAVHVFKIPVVAFGLRTDFQGNPFPGMAMLMSLAEDVQELKGICACGSKSTMNMRIDAQGKMVREGQRVLIGGNAQYRQVCAKCFYFYRDIEPHEPALKSMGYEFKEGETGFFWETDEEFSNRYFESHILSVLDAYRVEFRAGRLKADLDATTVEAAT